MAYDAYCKTSKVIKKIKNGNLLKRKEFFSFTFNLYTPYDYIDLGKHVTKNADLFSDIRYSLQYCANQ